MGELGPLGILWALTRMLALGGGVLLALGCASILGLCLSEWRHNRS